MTKSELIRRLASQYKNLNEEYLEMAVNSVFDEFTNALKENKRIEIRGFGAFTLRKREARVARNPKTNIKVALSERFSVYFRAGKELKSTINS